MLDKFERSRDQAYVFPHLRQAIEDTWRRADVSGIEAIDGVETHDCFTTTEYVALDHLGLSAPGQSWQAVEDGTIAPGGRCPVNMSGGLIGCGHPVGATGAIIANGLDATGAGLDGFTINYVPGNGFTIGQGEGTSSIDGSDIDITSSAASIDATNLSAGDDILLSAATTIAVDGGTTLGLGITGGDSSIRTQGGDTVLTNLDAFDDIVATSAGAISGDAIAAGRNLALTAVDAIDFGAITVGGTTTLTSSGGAVGVDALTPPGRSRQAATASAFAAARCNLRRLPPMSATR